MSKDVEKGRDLEDRTAITAIPSERDQLISQMSLSLQNANVQQALINNVVNDLKDTLSVTGDVVDIQTLSPSGLQIVRVINAQNYLFNFRIPDPNKPDNIFSEFQRAQNHNLLVRVKYSLLEKENHIKSIEVMGAGYKA